MKKIVSHSVLIIGLMVVGSLSGYADHQTHPEVLRAIQFRAEAVQQDAAIYQRKRVSSSVARLVADAGKLRNSLVVHACLNAEAEAIQKAIRDLRAVSLNSDAARTAKAVQKVSDLSVQVFAKVCEHSEADHKK